jgi:hypothetical protein
MRTATIRAALTAFLALGSVRAQAVEPTTLMLECTGTWERGKGDISLFTGIVVDLTAREVFGGGFQLGAPSEITGFDDVKIHFRGTRRFEGDWSMTLDGEIDRVTGDMRAVENSAKSREIPSQTATYSLKCRPTQRIQICHRVERSGDLACVPATR